MENTKHEKFLPLQALHLPSVQQRNLDRFEMSIRQSLRELRGVACLHTRIVFLLLAFAATSLLASSLQRVYPHLNVAVSLLLLFLCLHSPRFSRDLRADKLYLARLNSALQHLHLFYDNKLDGLMVSRGPPAPLQVVDSCRLLQLREASYLQEGAAEHIKRYRECLLNTASTDVNANVGPAS